MFLRVCLIQTTCFKGKGIHDLIQTLLKHILPTKYNGYYTYIIPGQSSKSSARKTNAGILRAEPFPVDIHAQPKKKEKKTRILKT